MLKNLSQEGRESLAGGLGVLTGIISIVAAGFIYIAVSDGSDDPLSLFNYGVGFALPALGLAVVLWFPTQWISNRILHPANQTKQES